MVVKVYKSQSEEFFLRLFSSLVIIPLVIAPVYLGSPYFNILILIGGMIVLWEHFYLCDKKPLWVIIGTIYIGISSFALLELRALEIMGLETVISLFIIVWGSDTGAFAFGKLIGGKKLAPRISPNKTWSGFVGGILCAIIVGAIAGFLFTKNNLLYICLISACIGAISQAGDLLESWLKRLFNKKDSGFLIPGHGGLFDRVDGLLPSATVIWVISFNFSNKSFLLWV